MQLGHQQGIAESEHRIHWIPGRAPTSRREPELARRERLTDRPEVDSGGIAFDAPHMVSGLGIGRARDARPNLRGTHHEPIALVYVLLIP